jgi:hypothetical protein
MALHKLTFDTTDADTRADSANVGAYLRSDDGTLLTHTTDGSREALDVYTELGKAEDSAHSSGDIGAMALGVRSDAGGTLVSADGDYSPLSIDASGNLRVAGSFSGGAEYAEDAAHTTGDTGNFILAVANHTEGALHSADGDYAALQVDDTGRLRVVADLDTTNLAEKAEDSAHSSADIGNYVLTVRQDTPASSTDADGDYQSFKSDSVGKLYVNAPDSDAILTTIDAVLDTIKTDTAALVVDLAAIEVELLDQGTTLDAIEVDTGSIDSTLTALSKSEDAAHSSGDQGIQALAVRNDTLASLVDTDGDYAPLQVNANGALYVEIAEGDDDDLADGTAVATANSVTTTAEDIVASPLASRKYLFVYNNGNRDCFIGGTGVTAGAGFPLPPGAMLEMRAGPSIDVEIIAEAGSQDIRALELS